MTSKLRSGMLGLTLAVVFLFAGACASTQNKKPEGPTAGLPASVLDLAPEVDRDPGHMRIVEALAPEDFMAVNLWLNLAERDHRKHVVLELDSPGGSSQLGHYIAKRIEEAHDKGVDVECVVDGRGISAAFYILQSCPIRTMTKRSKLMTHAPRYSEVDLTLEDAPNLVSGLQVTLRAFAEHCVHRMKVTMEEYMAKAGPGKEWWMDWEDALKFGAVDRVVDRVPSA